MKPKFTRLSIIPTLIIAMLSGLVVAAPASAAKPATAIDMIAMADQAQAVGTSQSAQMGRARAWCKVTHVWHSGSNRTAYKMTGAYLPAPADRQWHLYVTWQKKFWTLKKEYSHHWTPNNPFYGPRYKYVLKVDAWVHDTKAGRAIRCASWHSTIF